MWENEDSEAKQFKNVLILRLDSPGISQEYTECLPE